MSTEATSPSPPEIADEVAGWLIGGGILTTAFFPLAKRQARNEAPFPRAEREFVSLYRGGAYAAE